MCQDLTWFLSLWNRYSTSSPLFWLTKIIITYYHSLLTFLTHSTYSKKCVPLLRIRHGGTVYILVGTSVFNTQHITNSTIVYPVKMEYGWNFSISRWTMMVKSGLEKIFLKFLHAQAIFFEINLHHRNEEFWPKVQFQ